MEDELVEVTEYFLCDYYGEAFQMRYKSWQEADDERQRSHRQLCTIEEEKVLKRRSEIG